MDIDEPLRACKISLEVAAAGSNTEHQNPRGKRVEGPPVPNLDLHFAADPFLESVLKNPFYLTPGNHGLVILL